MYLYFVLDGLAEHSNHEELAIAVNLPKMPPKSRRIFTLPKKSMKLRDIEVDYGIVNKSFLGNALNPSIYYQNYQSYLNLSQSANSYK